MNQRNSTIELFSTFQPELRLPFPGSYSQWLHTFPDIFIELLANNTTNFSRFHNIINNNDNFIELLVNNATYFFRVYIKQDWYFQRVPSKLNHEKNFFESSYHTILTFRELLQTILTYSELISNSTNNSKHFFESFNGYILEKNKKFASENENSKHTNMKQIILPSTILEFTWLAMDGFMGENGLA